MKKIFFVLPILLISMGTSFAAGAACPQFLPHGTLGAITSHQHGIWYIFKLTNVKNFSVAAVYNFSPSGVFPSPVSRAKFNQAYAMRLYQQSGPLRKSSKYDMCSTIQKCTCQYNVSATGPFILLAGYTGHP